MRIETWMHGCKVTVSDWIGKDVNGETPIRIGVEYIRPGGAISRPEWEKAIYVARRDQDTVRMCLDSIVNHILEGRFGK